MIKKRFDIRIFNSCMGNILILDVLIRGGGGLRHIIPTWEMILIDCVIKEGVIIRIV